MLLFGYSWDGEPAQVIDLTREELPANLVVALRSDSAVKHAFNANFERVCLSRMLGMPEGVYLDPSQWRAMRRRLIKGPGRDWQVAAFLGVDAHDAAAREADQ